MSHNRDRVAIHLLLSPVVALSRSSERSEEAAKGLARWVEMLRCAQHDRAVPSMRDRRSLRPGVTLSEAKGRHPTQAHSQLRLMPIGRNVVAPLAGARFLGAYVVPGFFTQVCVQKRSG